MNANTVAVVSVSVTGALAVAQLYVNLRTTKGAQRHAKELATIESNRADVKNAHAALYRKLTGYLKAASEPSNPYGEQQPGPEQFETWQEFDEVLNDVWLMASPAAAQLGEDAVRAVAELAVYGHEAGPQVNTAYGEAFEAVRDYRAAIRRDRGLE